MPDFEATLDTGATGDGQLVPVVAVDGWYSTDQTPPVPTVYDTLKETASPHATTTSCSGATCAPIGAHTLLYTPNRLSISLDGAAGIDYFSLPAGFLIQDFYIKLILLQRFLSAGSTLTIYHNNVLLATYSTNGSGTFTIQVFDQADFTPAKFYSTFFDQIKIIATSTGTDTLTVKASYAGVTGTYILWSTQLTSSPANATTGNIITINDGAGLLNDVVSFAMVSSAGTVIVPTISGTRTANQVKLIVPAGLGSFGTRIYIHGLLTSGVVILGSFTLGIGGITLTGAAEILLLEDVSGIYTLTPDKTDDTVYNRIPATAETIDVKIPDPFAKTAFIPSNKS